MSNKTVYCIVDKDEQISFTIHNLKELGISEDQISVVSPSYAAKGTLESVGEAASEIAGGAVSGSKTGAVIGGALGLLAGAGLVTIPGIGAVAASGPILSALSTAAANIGIGATVGAGVGAGIKTIGTLANALISGLGLHETKAKTFEDAIQKGSALIAVEVPSEDLAQGVSEIYRRAGARDISATEKGDFKAL
ncbi:MAG: hypothetical protein K0S07_1361 [Chlamydiales bacterium]|jgi:hypothetical protein|nr:hypothetical protein [Chlamydiales bacterium]